MSFKHISVSELKTMLDAQEVVLVDTRDEASFKVGHIEDAAHLNDRTIASFIEETDKVSSVVVVCYHGHSSQSAASFLVEQGFSDVYSLDGGYTAWAASAHD